MTISRTLMRATFRIYFLGITGAALVCGAAWAAETKPPPQILFTNVNIFDGKSDSLAMGMSVLVEGILIKSVGKDVKGRADARTINGGGRTLMPGLIDGHAHTMINVKTPRVIQPDAK